jgi:nicotinate-nucleotide pyrophosphorylase (carboxylating)
MRSSTISTTVLAATTTIPLLTVAHTNNSGKYTLTDDLSYKNFFPAFDFFSSPDPTNGFVEYQNLSSAISQRLLGYLSPKDTIFLGVDSSSKSASGGRASVRLESKKSWNQGLLIADIRHMPAPQCGVWPAFWLLSASRAWPEGGEIDILEGVNEQVVNVMTLHTAKGCVVDDSNSSNSSVPTFTGTMVTSDCDVEAPGQEKNVGCSIRAEEVQPGCMRNTTDGGSGSSDDASGIPPSYGTQFNNESGGVYAMEWTPSSISVWVFPRNSIGYTQHFAQFNKSSITTSPDPETWGPPITRFSGPGCDFRERFVDMKVIFNTAFCGDWAGKEWDQGCAAKTGVQTCEEYVGENPEAFREAYWEIEGLRWFQKI